MPKNSFGIMPKQPIECSLCKIKGDGGTYEVTAIDWLNNRVGVFRASENQWIPIKKVKFIIKASVE